MRKSYKYPLLSYLALTCKGDMLPCDRLSKDKFCQYPNTTICRIWILAACVNLAQLHDLQVAPAVDAIAEALGKVNSNVPN